MKTIFVSYASADTLWKDRVVSVFDDLQKAGRVKLWQDVAIASGGRWHDEIVRQLRRADAFLVLASESYLASDYIRKTEFPLIRQRTDKGETRLFWIPLDSRAVAESGGDGILEFLLLHQAAHGNFQTLTHLNEQAVRGGHHLSDALLRLRSRVGAWLDQEGAAVTEAVVRPAVRPAFSLAELERIERRYLTELRTSLRYLNVSSLGNPPASSGRPLRQLPLEKIYITLRADPTTLADRLQTRALHRELAEAEEELPALTGALRPAAGSPQRVIDRILAERESSLPALENDPEGNEELILEQAFRQERILVILGHPGSGKSVLCRWLALQMSKQLLEERPAQDGPRPREAPDLGPPRLPILVRVADLVTWFNEHIRSQGRGVPPDLLVALEANAGTAHSRGLSDLSARQASALFRQALEDDRAVLLLDGLDEVPDAEDRELITDAVEALVDRFVFRAKTHPQAPPGESGGNQILVTSRVTGYHLAPLRFESEIAAHYLIRPLDDKRVRLFCGHVAQLFDDYNPEESLGDLLLADLEKSSLPGLDRLKRNPLLLTSLITYWYPRRRLPRSRAELYRALLLDLCAHWRSMEGIMGRLSPRLREWLDEDEKVLDLLGVIGQEIYLHHPTGRIARASLEQIVLSRLVMPLVGKSPLELEAGELRAFDADVEGVFSLIATQAGALVEDGNGVFRFLHLTFQEYLVGRRLVQELPGDQPEEILVDAFLDRVADPRWREPLLFGFGELGLQDSPAARQIDRRKFLGLLRVLGTRRRPVLLADFALFCADLILELVPEETDVWETVMVLVQAYRGCGASRAAEKQRLRIAERFAALRRSGAEVDRMVCGILAADADLTPALAHLYWERRWLVPEILDAFATQLHLDTAEWGWPLHSALRWSLLPEDGRLDPEPVDDLKLPAGLEEDDEAIRIRRRFEQSYEAWEEMTRAHAERVLSAALPAERFELRGLFLRQPRRWSRLLEDPACARAVIALLTPVDDWRAGFWIEEYRRLARFLQNESEAREAMIDRDPAAFVPRWGLEDVVYNCAVYLDNNVKGRFKLHREKTVLLLPEFMARRLPAALEVLFRRCSEDPQPARTMRNGLGAILAEGDEVTRAEAALGLLAMGEDSLEALRTTRGSWGLDRTLNALSDAVFRGGTQAGARWFGPDEEALDDSEAALVYRKVAETLVTVAAAPFDVGNSREGAHLKAIAGAERWARAFSIFADDAVFEFKTCLETLKPEPTGWNHPLLLLAAIQESANGRLLAVGPAGGPPLWGVSPQERLVPPAFFDVLWSMSFKATHLHPELGAEFASLFLSQLPAEGVVGRLSALETAWWGADDEGGGLPPSPSSLALLESDNTFEHAVFFEHSLHGELLAAESLQKARRIAADLAARSPIDEALFLARMAELAPDGETAAGLLRGALMAVPRIADPYTRTETLARLRRRVIGEPGLRILYDTLAQSLENPVFRAYAQGRLGRFLTSPKFAWNAPELLGDDPAWGVTAVVAALLEARQEVQGQSGDGEYQAEWADLAARPSLEKLDRLLNASRDNRFLCSSFAAEGIEKLHHLPEAQKREIRPERLLPLLIDSKNVRAQQRVQRWLAGASAGTPAATVWDRLLSGQAAILLAESHRDLQPEWIEPLFQAVEIGDDLQAGRAELLLAGPWRFVDRKNRRFRTSQQGLGSLRALSRKRRDLSRVFAANNLRHVATCSINDWIMDSPEELEEWCRQADGDPQEEAALIGVFRDCDLWSSRCQEIGASWLIAESGGERREDRLSVLLDWTSRQHYLGFAEELLYRCLELNAGPLLRESRTIPSSGGNLKHLDLLAAVCIEASERAVGDGSVAWAEAVCDREMESLLVDSGRLDLESLSSVGQLAYQQFHDFPERSLGAIGGDLDRPLFRRCVRDWLLVCLDKWNALTPSAAETLAGDVLKRKLEALLCFATCLSARSEDAYSRLFEPEVFLLPLARVCHSRSNHVSLMAAITLISRLKQVDLDLLVLEDAEGKELTVLDALLNGLRGGTEVQTRVSEVLPRIFRLRGQRVVERLGEMLTGEDRSGSTRLSTGSEVLAATQLMVNFLRRGSLREPAVRRQALDLLHHAASAPYNRRPLYRRAGSGAKGEPINVQSAGNLSDEIAKILTQL